MVQTRSRAQSRPNWRRAKSISNPNPAKSVHISEECIEEEQLVDSIGRNSEVNKQSVDDKYVLGVSEEEPQKESVVENVYTDDDNQMNMEEEDGLGLGESDTLRLEGIIDSISYDVVPNDGVSNEQVLEESSDFDEEDVTDDVLTIEQEMKQEYIEYDSEDSNEEKKVIHFNDKGQPIGEGSGPFTSKVGKITRKHCPVSYAKWRDVPGKTIDSIWKRITDKYVIPVAFKPKIMDKIRNSWRKYKCMLRANHYDSYHTDEERKRNCPKGVKQDVWNKFVDNESTPAAQTQRILGKKARQAMKTPHFSGRSGAARVAEAMKKRNPSGTVTRTELYLALHSRADGSCPAEVEKIKAIAMENPSSINLDVDHDPVAQVCGPERSGKSIRGLGCGVSKASLRHSAPATHHLQQERSLRIAAENKLAELGVNVDSPKPVETHPSGTSWFQNTPILRKRKSISEPRNSVQQATPSCKKRRGFEDDDSDMDYEDDEGLSDEDESETEFRESVADDIPSGSNVEKKVIRFNDKGQPVGDGSAPFTSELGRIARKHCPVSYEKWKAVPGPTRDTLWKLVTDKYVIPEIYRVKVLERMRNCWKKYKSLLRSKYYDAYNTDEERKRNRPNGIKQVIWNKFVDNESSPAAQALRISGRIARQSMKTPHVSGRTGAARMAEALKKQNPSGTVTRTELYVALHSRPDGSCPTPELTEKVEKIKAIAKEKPDSVNLDIDHDPVAQVYGRERSGRAVRGLGLGVSRLSVIYSAPAMLHLEEERRLRTAAEKKISGFKKQIIHQDPAPKEVSTLHPWSPEEDTRYHPSLPAKVRSPHHSAPEEDRSHPSAPDEDMRSHLSAPKKDKRAHPLDPEEDRRSHLSAKPKIVIPPMKKTQFYCQNDILSPEMVDEISGSKSREAVDLADDGDRRMCVFEDVRREQNVSAEEELAILKQQLISQKEQIGELQQEREVITELKKQISSQGLLIADMKELFARLTS